MSLWSKVFGPRPAPSQAEQRAELEALFGGDVPETLSPAVIDQARSILASQGIDVHTDQVRAIKALRAAKPGMSLIAGDYLVKVLLGKER